MYGKGERELWLHSDGQRDWGSLTLSNERFPNIDRAHLPPPKIRKYLFLQQNNLESIFIYLIFLEVKHSTIWNKKKRKADKSGQN